MFACVPAEAMRVAMSTILLSVVAMLLPSSTATLPNRSKFVCAMPVMFANCANDELALSAVRSVVSAKSAMTPVNDTTFWVAMPSCPALAAMSAKSP